MNRIFTLLFFTIISLSPLWSQPGGLDISFATGGVFRGMYSDLHESPHDVVVLPSKKLLVIFSGYPEGNLDQCVTRLNEDGLVDSTFAEGGLYYHSNPLGSELAYDLEVLDDGSMIMAGSYSEDLASSAFMMIKLSSEGIPDSTFGVNGIMIHEIDEGQDYIQSIAIAEDGKIVAGGNTHYPGLVWRRNVVARYHANGEPDLLFGNNGIFIWQENETYNSTESIALAEDGSIYAAGHAHPSGAYRPSLYKVKADGSGLDSTFANNGQALAPATGRGFGMTVHPNGNILVTHEAGAVSGTDLGITAFHPDGSVNLDFGNEGVFTIDNGSSDIGKDIVVQPDGKILVCAESGAGFADNQFLTVRCDENGVLDTSWGDNGKVVTQPANADFSFPNAIAVQPHDGKVLVTGVGAFFSSGGNEVVVVRYGNEIDADMDGFFLGIDDCDDMDAGINPDAVEIPNNGIDEDCDGMDLLVGVDESTLSLQFQVYPNPARDMLFIDYNASVLKPQLIEIMDYTGKRLQLIEGQAESSSIAIQLDALPSGLLVLAIHMDRGVAVKKIVKE